MKPYFKLLITKYLNPTDDREDEVVSVQEIRDGVSFRGSNILILMIAIVVASLGLNTNSTAVIIGAMLISPLMGPIMGIGLGLGVYDFELIKRAARNLAVAALFSVIASTLYFLISPVSEERSELLARTSPTIYDVLIAFFGGGAGIVAISCKQKGNVIPGVAIATALMPPLCTAGYGLATFNMHYFLGAFYLFIINSTFIAFATTVGVKLFKYKKKTFVDPRRAVKVQRIVYIILFLAIAPSVVITYNMLRENFFQAAANKFVNTEFVFPQTQVLNKHAYIEKGNKYLSVTLIGQEIPRDSIMTLMQSRMQKAGLGGVTLNIIQGSQARNGDNIDAQMLQSTISSNMFKDIYLNNQERITKQNHIIDSLKVKIRNYADFDSLSIAIAPEMKVLYPQVSEVAIVRPLVSSVDSTKAKTETMAIVKYKNRAMTKLQEKQMRLWLEARLNVKSIRIVNSTEL